MSKVTKTLDKALRVIDLSREQKIKNIIQGTEESIEKLKKEGKLTPQLHSEIINRMNNTIAAIK